MPLQLPTPSWMSQAMWSWHGFICGEPWWLPPKLKRPKKKDVAYYQGQVATADYFITCHIPTTLGKMNGLTTNYTPVMEIPEEAFIG